MGNFLDALEDLVKSTEIKTNEKVNEFRDELSKLDLTTDEGYSKYMNFLADLRIKASKHNAFFKAFLGEDASTMIDRIAQEATNQYMKAKKEREAEEARKAEEERKAKLAEEARKADEDKQKQNKTAKTVKFDISKDHEQEKNDDLYASISRIVKKYINNEIKPMGYKKEMCDLLEAELIEYTCWLHKTDLN